MGRAGGLPRLFLRRCPPPEPLENQYEQMFRESNLISLMSVKDAEDVFRI